MFRRIHLGTAGAVLALVASPLGVLFSQTPQGAPTTGQTPPINPPVIQNRTKENPTTPTVAGSSSAEVAADSGFIRDALAASLLEVRLGTIARDKASNGEVKAFGRRMVSQHSTLRDQWLALAQRNGINTNQSLDPAAEDAANKLAALSGAEFDRAYMSEMVQAHQADIAKFQQAGSSADAAEVRQLATNALPAMQQHLTQAQALANRLGGTGVATPTPSKPERDQNVGNRDLAAADRQYVNEVAVGHLMEVRLAEMAQRKAKDPEVKRLADRLHDDFSKWLSRWSDLNGREPHMGKLHQEKITRLEKANARQFDRTYVDIVTENINSMIPYFQKEGRAAKTAKVRNLVNDELPTLRQNLDAARGINRRSLSSNK
jgi:putative membrane protein